MPKDLDQQIRRHHVIGKAKASCSVAEIMAEQAKAFGDKAMSQAQVYDIVKKVKNGENKEDNRGKAINKFVRTEEMINDVKRFIEEDRCVDVAQLASVFDVSTGTIFNIIHDDLLQLPGAGNPVVLLLLAEELGDPAGGLLDEAEVVMDDVEDGPSGDIKDRGQLSHINTSVLFNEPLDIIDHLLSPDKLVDSLAPVVLHVQDGVAQYI